MKKTSLGYRYLRPLLAISLFLSAVVGLRAQEIGLKTNALYWGTTTPNLGLEMAFNKKWSMDLSGGLNLWTFENNRKFRHWSALPELRYWTCESFNGHFFGLHGLLSHYNVSDINIPVGRLKNLKDYRHQGWAYGAGLTYGYQFVLSRYWNLEFSISGGYIYFDNSKYNCATCGRLIEKSKEHYLGVTKATLSLIYIIK